MNYLVGERSSLGVTGGVSVSQGGGAGRAFGQGRRPCTPLFRESGAKLVSAVTSRPSFGNTVEDLWVPFRMPNNMAHID